MRSLEFKGGLLPNAMAIVGWDEGGAGQIHSWIENTGWSVACFVHPEDQPPKVNAAKERTRRATRQFDFPTQTTFKNRPLLSAKQWPQKLKELGINNLLIILADPQEQHNQIQLAKQNGFRLINAIHPSATLMADVILHENVVIHARAVVGYRAELYPGVSLNTGSQIDHHSVLYHCVHVDPGVTTAGNVVIERFAQVHTRATIINRIRIGEGAIIGAGAVIIRDVPPRVTVVGIPGRILT